ncbi:MAG TPA: hypothetical protein PK920_11025 [Phycisphaerae bacterium]|jgi:hypothetical protein|nr:hypothetical protein [Phycisphaerae bacterium]
MKLDRSGMRALGALVVVLSFVAGSALADVSEVVLRITASSGRGTGVLEITADEGIWDGGDFFWSNTEDISLMSGDQVVGTIVKDSYIAISSNPQIAMGFSFQAGDAATDVTLTSALLSFPTIANASARADAAFTVMDIMGEGVSLVGLQPGGGAYRAYYNDSITFAEAIGPIDVIPPATLAEGNFAYPGGGAHVPIGVASNMGAEIAFSLSAYGFVSGSSNFEIVPEPAGLLLLAVGVCVLRRR